MNDTHCHLDFRSFDDDRDQVVERARQEGVGKILNPGIDLTSSKAAAALTDQYPEVYAGVGVHPNDARTFDKKTISELRILAAHPKIVAIGEIGLDYYRDSSPRDLQKEILLQQLALAAELRLPVIIHNRDADEDLLEVLGEWQRMLDESGSPLADRPGVLHSFTGKAEVAAWAEDHHFYLGIGGPVTFKNAPALQELVASLDPGRLILETDAPFLAPHPQRGKRNEPAYVRLTAEKVAALMMQSLPAIIDATSNNAARLFNW